MNMKIACRCWLERIVSFEGLRHLSIFASGRLIFWTLECEVSGDKLQVMWFILARRFSRDAAQMKAVD